MSSPKEAISLQLKAEQYTPSILDKIDISINPLSSIYRIVEQEVKEVVKGSKNSSAIYVEGLYGTGKTLLLRKFFHDIVNDEAYDKIIPIYYYLGETDFLPFTVLSEYIDAIDTYINEKMATKPNIVGKPSAWEKRVEVLRKCHEESGVEDEVEGLYKCMQRLNKLGYYPALIFDEFERLIYTGEGVKSDTSRKAFADFLKRYLELTRGHIFSGLFVLATTRPIRELVEKAVDEERPHIFRIADQLGIPREKIVDQFPLLSPNIYYDVRERIVWNKVYLELLSKKYNLTIHEDILHVISRVLPTPRAVVQISKKILATLGSPEVLSPKDFFQIIETEFDEFIRRLETEKVDDKWIITPQTKWHERFRTLVENGFYVITRNDYVKVAEVLGITDIDPRKLKQKVNNMLQKLYNIGLYVRAGTGTYLLDPYILAFSLGIERLPTGETSSIDDLMLNIKSRIKHIRGKTREKTRKGQEGS